MGTFIGLSIYVPVYFETARGLTRQPVRASALIPLMVGTVVGRHHRRPADGAHRALQAPAIGLASRRSAPLLALRADDLPLLRVRGRARR